MIPQTSREAWASIQSGLPYRRWQALQWVKRYEGKTAAELEALSGLRHLNKRLSELQRQGVVEARGLKESPTSHMTGVRWWSTGEQQPLPIPKKPSRGALEKELESAMRRLKRARAFACVFALTHPPDSTEAQQLKEVIALLEGDEAA